ncbi:protein kinase domain-containing protein [Mastigocoleus testarum]|uniref:non-specific serine/threonine protein kinase n=1 Tax=Mastigocoleus testarum BC008 TaxID=371196 RepID=A0A0V7ZEF4_9CYAN|nr:RDD family protein [Mastigocoleus testarum]KST62944.1 serine/threonine protein kinase [Mastigocoleus testarum BC008]KST63035.1 serine/threonine protein kinase [Mastigocoleus testarum BC008]
MSICINPHCSERNNHRDMLFCRTCGSELLLQGSYRVKTKLGGGGFGETYELADKNGKRKVLKVLIDERPKAIELFKREAEVLKVLNHPGIPKVEENGYFLYLPRNTQKHLHCLIMEKIEGLNLSKYIQQQENKPIHPKLALTWLRELTLILQEVHSQHFFHRDIKPSNIMLRADGRLALIDFGTVREVTKTYVAKKAAGDITGIISSGYTPIEQINGQAVQQSDFFALGRTFIYLLTGKSPSQLYEPCTNVLEWRYLTPEISPEFADILDEMMAHSAYQRPKNTQIILQKLDAIDTALPSAINVKRLTKKAVKQESQIKKGIRYANAWMRFLAYLTDLIILFFIGIFFGGCAAYLAYSTGFITESENLFDIGGIVWISSVCGFFPILFSLITSPEEIGTIDIVASLFGIIINWLYFISFEMSAKKATPGKQSLDIHITDLSQNKISFVQANIRYWTKSLSISLLMIGFLITAFTRKRQGLHDIFAKTIITKKFN